jgi:molecular chaperone GrpE
VFRRKSADESRLEFWADDAHRHDTLRANAADAAIDKLNQFLQGIGDGYAMSLRRVERALPAFGLEPIDCVGRPFDPDTMEVVELGDGGPAGTVLEEVRRGYRWNGTVFRFAQVKVAR